MTRSATEQDILAIEAIERSVFKEDAFLASFWLTEMSENPLSKVIVALKSGSVVGHIALRILGVTSEIVTIAVHIDYRSQGIARELLDAAILELKAANVHELSLEVRKSNKAARHLYESYGFKQAYIRKHYYGNEDAYVYLLEVSHDHTRS
jgi:[ribosomal protein S18]-alanine N-acetyltransferase